MFTQDRVDGAAQVAHAFAVNEAHLQNAPGLTGSQIIRHQMLHIARIERVQIQHPVNRQFDGIGIAHDSPSFRDLSVAARTAVMTVARRPPFSNS